ncbi:MAG TPA: hypothetical protein VND98_11965 [Solirubrobacterales bacterium]|nr:hypothetical protein [Solirubrobacterales bacterium]
MVVDEFNSAGDYRGQIVAPPPVIIKPFEPENPHYTIVHRMTEAEPSGLAIGSYLGEDGGVYNDALYVSAGNSEGGAVWIFAPSTIPGHTLTLTKTGSGDGTVTSQPYGITCGTACATEYEEEQAVNLFAYSDPHSDFAGWNASGPGTESCLGEGSCTVLIFGDAEVKADFEAAPQKAFAVSISGDGTVASKPAGISCPGHCSEEFAEGRAISLLAKPSLHQRILAWSGCDSQPGPSECKLTMSEARSVSVSFAPIPPETLTVSLAGPGTGEVTSYPWGISCPGRCSARFDEGSTVYLIASPDPGFTFAGWEGAGCSGGGLCAARMGEAEAVRAEFVPSLPPIESPPPESQRGPATLPTPHPGASQAPHKEGRRACRERLRRGPGQRHQQATAAPPLPNRAPRAS